MVVAMTAVGGVAAWDEAREGDAALEDFGQQQAMLARGAAAALSAKLATATADAPPAQLFDTLTRLEIPGAVMIAIVPPLDASPDSQRELAPAGSDSRRAIAPPSASPLLSTDGRPLDDAELARAIADGRST